MTEKLKNLIEDELKSAFVHGRTEAESEYRDLLDKAKDEAYQRGYKDCETRYCSFDACPNRQAEYQRGLDDAWECARKIAKLWTETDNDDLLSMFGIDERIGHSTIMALFGKQTASEALSKLHAYEQRKEDVEIKVGDEIEDYDGKYVVEYIDLSENCIYAVRNDGQTFGFHGSYACKVKKTGRHFPEVAALLEKMKGE